MGEVLLRRVASAGLVVLLLGAGWVYLGLPERHGPAPDRSTLRVAAAGSAYATGTAFHAGDRPGVRPSEAAPESPCGSCHGRRAHWRDRARRAFLNAHDDALDCGACHLQGPGVAVRRFRAGQVVTAATLASGAGGRLYAAHSAGDAWTRRVEPGSGVTLASRGPACGACHRRDSPFLAAEGLYDPYRRRVLEDLAVLRRIEGTAW